MGQHLRVTVHASSREPRRAQGPERALRPGYLLLRPGWKTGVFPDEESPQFSQVRVPSLLPSQDRTSKQRLSVSLWARPGRARGPRSTPDLHLPPRSVRAWPASHPPRQGRVTRGDPTQSPSCPPGLRPRAPRPCTAAARAAGPGRAPGNHLHPEPPHGAAQALWTWGRARGPAGRRRQAPPASPSG